MGLFDRFAFDRVYCFGIMFMGGCRSISMTISSHPREGSIVKLSGWPAQFAC